jgi:hypothetical protein
MSEAPGEAITGWNMPENRLARLDAERHDVLDLEVNRVSGRDVTASPRAPSVVRGTARG